VSAPTVAILFWFYSEPEVCAERIALLRGQNPGAPLYGLYGGPAVGAATVVAHLGPLLDDLYVYPGDRSSEWKWRHGDRLIADWHAKRGRQLPWDVVAVVQWDLLLAAPVREVFGELRAGEAVFSGLRPLAEVDPWWGWAGVRDPAKRPERDAFESWLRDAGLKAELWCCLFIAVALPRPFLDRYAAEAPEAGFLEYKTPTLAAAWGFKVRAAAALTPWWAADPATREADEATRALNAMGQAVSPALVATELARAGGRRAFHPVREPLAPALLQALSVAERCGVCASGFVAVHQAREMMQGLRTPFRYGECAGCGGLQLLDPPADPAPYYAGGYYSFGADLDAEFADAERRARTSAAVRTLLTAPEAEAAQVEHADMRRPLWSLRPLAPAHEARILDVGCGAGRLLYLLQLGGWTDLTGVDAHLPEGRSHGEGLKLRRGTLADAEGPWDLIMYHHAFEHLADPVGELRTAAARLAPGGSVLIRTPLADSEAWRRYGPDWVQLDAPRHLFIPTLRSLELAAVQAGLRVTGVAHDSYELQFWGSEQYRLDIPLQDARSYRWGQGAPLFTPEQIAGWRAESEQLNREGRGDQAAIYLRPV
jgi:SAM-dependent methyltransferase